MKIVFPPSVNSVINSYEAEYAHRNLQPATIEKLKNLKSEERTIENFEKIVGNRSWTRLNCDECGGEYKILMELGESNCSTVKICHNCLLAANVALNCVESTLETN